MFTGIVEKTAGLLSVSDGPMFRRLTFDPRWPDVKLGQSVAVNGVCLTVAELKGSLIGFDVIKETLDKTNLGALAAGERVNLERSLLVGERIDGHFVQGHVDGTGTLVDQVVSENEWRLTIQAPDHLSKYLIPKGSICIDGVSLTIAGVDRNRFDVALIPTTLQLTNLESRRIGWTFNLECDVLSKTIVSWLERQRELVDFSKKG